MQNKLSTDEILQIAGLVGKIVYEVCAQKDFLQAFNDGLEIMKLFGINQNHLIAAMMSAK